MLSGGRTFPNSTAALMRSNAVTVYAPDRALSDRRLITVVEVYNDLRCAALLALDNGYKSIAREHARHTRMLIEAFGIRVRRDRQVIA